MSGADLTGLVEQVTSKRGGFIMVLELDTDDASDLASMLRQWFPEHDSYGPQYRDDPPRVVLIDGAECLTATTAASAVATVLNLADNPVSTIADLTEALEERPLNSRVCVVFANATDLVRDEDPELWCELVEDIRMHRTCFGVGWCSVILAATAQQWAVAPERESRPWIPRSGC